MNRIVGMLVGLPRGGGIKVPFKIYITQGGKKYADVAVEDYHVNTGLKLADLERRR